MDAASEVVKDLRRSARREPRGAEMFALTWSAVHGTGYEGTCYAYRRVLESRGLEA
jgi:hypothetical protein